MINFINLIKLGLRGGMVSPHSKRVPSPNPGGGLSVWSVHVPPRVCVGSLSVLRLPPTAKKNMHVRLTGYSKLSARVSVSVDGWLSLRCPVMDLFRLYPA